MQEVDDQYQFVETNRKVANVKYTKTDIEYTVVFINLCLPTLQSGYTLQRLRLAVQHNIHNDPNWMSSCGTS